MTRQRQKYGDRLKRRQNMYLQYKKVIHYFATLEIFWPYCEVDLNWGKSLRSFKHDGATYSFRQCIYIQPK